MDPITLFIIFKIASAITAGVAVAHFVQLTLATIFSWFRSRSTLSVLQKENIAVTINRGLNNGKYEIVRGVFNKYSQTMVESELIRADRLDGELASRHNNQRVVYYQSYEY